MALALVGWCGCFASCKEEMVPPAELIAGLELWPLPFTDTLHVELQHRGTGELNYALYNMQGQPLRTGNFPLPTKKPLQTYLLLTELPTGQYVLQCTYGEEEVSRRIVKSDQEPATFD